MVNSIWRSSSEDIQSALLDYLNFNRHKFDKRGRFDASPRANDYVPQRLARFDVRPDHVPMPAIKVADSTSTPTPKDPWDVDTWDDENAKLEKLYEAARKNGVRLDEQECNRIVASERNRCHTRWKQWPYSELWPDAFKECWERANERGDWCKKTGEMPAHLPEYGAYDASKQPKDPDRTRPQKQEGLPQASWAMTRDGRSKAPIAEGPDSPPLPGFETSLPIPRRIPRIRVTPGMGFGGVVRGGRGGGGGKRPLMPYNPLDTLAPMKLY